MLYAERRDYGDTMLLAEYGIECYESSTSAGHGDTRYALAMWEKVHCYRCDGYSVGRNGALIKGRGIALYPFQRSFVQGEQTPAIAQFRQPVQPDLLALPLHALAKRPSARQALFRALLNHVGHVTTFGCPTANQ